MGRLSGKVALVTGAARGQGRSHAVRMAQEGADIIAVDLCADVGSVPYGLATESDLTETHLIAAGGGAFIATSSIYGLKGAGNLAHYTAAKHGVSGLIRSMTHDLAPYGVRVNSVHPTAVNTDMIQNDPMYRLFRPDLDAPTAEDAKSGFAALNLLPTPWIEPLDVSQAVVFLASDEARYITGVSLPVDAGCMQI